MSFGINNGPENIPAIQKSHQTTDGGAVNLGYFQQGNQKKKEQKKDELDVFESSSKKKEENDEDFEVNLESIGTRIKNFWLKLHGLLKDEKKSDDIKPSET